MIRIEIHRIYPKYKVNGFFRRNRLDLLRSAFLLAAYTCLIVNLFTGDMSWSLIVIGGLCVAWVAFVYKPLVENTLIKKLSDVSIAVCLYLFLLDAVLQQGWSIIVIPIVFFSDLVLIGFIFLVFFKKQKRNFMPLYELLLGGLVAILLSLTGVQTLNWPRIVVGSVSLGLLVLSVALFPKDMAKELRKKLHL
ncbi:MAG: DUF6320 domain-containing protein [Clostridia bacterium]|nr:DUF6320 domain-containing protein [Clostridia bacterium]